jgi:hypothetical protein
MDWMNMSDTRQDSWCEQARQQGVSPLDWLELWTERTEADLAGYTPDEMQAQVRRWMRIARECLEDAEQSNANLGDAMQAVGEFALVKSTLAQLRVQIDCILNPSQT